ncbi:MAG: hypothetical protein IT385_02905 [Deltaproteobacteria bacterium]|nr:hypothetical protein [Deltaproteobacteria bacterium]
MLRLVFVASLVSVLVACGDDPKKRLGATCGDDAECESGLCVVSLCMEPSADTDGDGLVNEVEARLGTSPLLADTDADGARDIDELDQAGANLDGDGDGKPDAIESADADADGDCIPDEQDPDDAAVDPEGCGDKLVLGASCTLDAQCESGLCVEVCLDPAADEDADGLTNAVERQLGTNPRAADTDADGDDDPDELDQAGAHVDGDGDGKPDALESADADADGDCLPDEEDPQDATADPAGCGGERAVWNVVFEPGIDVSICRGSNLFWSSQNLQVDGRGAFDETWAVNEPNTARVSGTLGETTFQATLACVSGAASGTLTATRSGDHYAGTYSFQGQSGSILVFPGDVDTITVQGRVSQSGTNLPIAGAVVRASVDQGAQATTGPTGLFYLQTSAPTMGGAAAYRIIITATGYATLDQEHTWGDHPTMQSFQLTPSR